MTQTSLFPVRPAATAEQETLPIDGTLRGAYAVWRASAAGQEAFDIILYRAVALVLAGEQRISAKALFEWTRAQHKMILNNSFTALVSRELLDREPGLRGLLEMRKRVAT